MATGRQQARYDSEDAVTSNFSTGSGAELYTAVLSDVLDEFGFTGQAMLPRIRPLDDDLVLVGFARTGQFREVSAVASGENPYELEIAIIDDLSRGRWLRSAAMAHSASRRGASC
jgi:hypothetical protein